MQSIMVGSIPTPLLQAVQHKIGVIAPQAEDTDPTLQRYAHGGSALLALYREPCPWTAVLEFQRALALAEQAGDERLDLTIRAGYIDLAWLDLGDVEGARQRLLALEARLEPSQEAVAVCFWRCLLAQVLCELEDEAGWRKAEQLVAPLLTDTGGHAIFVALAQCVVARLARLARLRGQLNDADVQARVAMQFFPLLPTLENQLPDPQPLLRSCATARQAGGIRSSCGIMRSAQRESPAIRYGETDSGMTAGGASRSSAIKHWTGALVCGWQ